MIVKRETIDNSIIRELKEKYPPYGDTNEVCYKVKLEYLTFETDFIVEPTISYLIDEHGVIVVALIHFFRTKMCTNGWCIRVDGFYLNQLLKECSSLFNTTKEELKNVYDELIENDYFFVVSDESVVKGTYLTCTQQIFNYELASAQRKREREKKQKQREKQQIPKENKIDEETNIIDEISVQPEKIDAFVEIPEEANRFFDNSQEINEDDERNYF